MNALSTIVKEYRITRRQARELRKLKDYSTAYTFRRCADTYMKCARIVRKALIKDEADKHNGPQG